MLGGKKKKQAKKYFLCYSKASELESLDGGEYMIETRKERCTKLITGSKLGVFKPTRRAVTL